MPKDPLKSPQLYINRELSWLEFNQRVLDEGLSDELPLLERLKFFAIVSSNLDEFFLVRVAGLMRRRAAKVRRRDVSGMTPAEQIEAISLRVHKMYAQLADGIRGVLEKLARHGLVVWSHKDWTEEHRQFLKSYFTREIMPILTPLAMDELDPRPLLPGLQMYVAAVIAPGAPPVAEGLRSESAEKIVVVPIPLQLSRFIALPSEKDLHLAWLEDVIAANLSSLFPGCEVLASAVFRIARDADVELHDDEVENLLSEMEKAVFARRRRAAVRLSITSQPDPRLKKWLMQWLNLGEDSVYEMDTLNAAAFMELVNRAGFDDLKLEDWPPQQPRDLIGADDLWQAVQDHDVLLFHPYESFDPVVRLLEQAAEDPQVLAIKQTLYRTSGDSPIVRALGRAAQNGKEVTALVELKARFDEARNINWARRLEDAGVHVIYGIAGYKTHAKALLIVRRQEQHIHRYVHLATGNYNDRTARLYSDIGLMTCDRDIASDVAAFFNLLTAYSESVGWSKLAIAPTGLKQRFLDLIDREIQVSTPDRPGLIMAKTNSLQDPEICRALFRASKAGVKIMLNVRGICCLRPGIPGVSEHIEVRSIVDRFLEHSRIFYFFNGGHEEVYLSSADLMQRNLSRRLEILFPVIDPNLRRRLIKILETYFADNVKARRLLPDSSYEPIARNGAKVRAQQKFYQAALAAVREAAHAEPQFRPLTSPKE
ncbi:MAG: polyphosphate kinase 1 [Thermoguttaceae bacterium]|jgi:polyphosphate kinase